MTNEQLCKGYQLVRYTNTRCLETLFAVLPDGRVFKSSEREFSTRFLTHGMQWAHVEALPDEAVFIGNYPVPAL